MDFNKLREEIENTSEQCFAALREKYSKDNICSYALYSDAGAMSISPAINTKNNLIEMCKDDPEDCVYYKWTPAEWDHEFEGAKYFEDISQKLQEESKKLDTLEEFTAFRNHVYKACLESLKNLVENGFFSKEADYIIVFTISDAEDFESEIKWVEQLNNEKNVKEFSNWVKSL